MDLSNPNIREAETDGLLQLERLYSCAFPEENLLPLLEDLHHDNTNVFSFIFEEQGSIIGHISFTACHVGDQACKLALLGPVAIFPKRQKQGIGSSLIRHGLKFLTENEFIKVLVLGDPDYYGRFGFQQERAITPAYAIPKEWRRAWQSIELSVPATMPSGKLIVPAPWQNSQLWSD